MLFDCHSKILHKHCLQFLLGVKMAPRETENNAYAKFEVTNKENYGMLWYFRSGQLHRPRVDFPDTVSVFLQGCNLNWAKTLKVCFPFLHYLLKAENLQLVLLVHHHWPAKGRTPRTPPPTRLMPRHAKAWKFKRPVSQNEQTFWTENLFV